MAAVISGGKLDADIERGRVVGDILTINKLDFLVNDGFRFQGSLLTLDAKDVQATLKLV